MVGEVAITLVVCTREKGQVEGRLKAWLLILSPCRVKSVGGDGRCLRLSSLFVVGIIRGASA